MFCPQDICHLMGPCDSLLRRSQTWGIQRAGPKLATFATWQRPSAVLHQGYHPSIGNGVLHDLGWNTYPDACAGARSIPLLTRSKLFPFFWQRVTKLTDVDIRSYDIAWGSKTKSLRHKQCCLNYKPLAHYPRPQHEGGACIIQSWL